MSDPLSPWSESVQKALQLGSGSSPLLLVGTPGSLQMQCAREIHETAGGGNLERVACTPDSTELRTQLFGPAAYFYDEFSFYDPDLPVGAVQRAIGGTLFLDSIDRCGPNDSNWIPAFLKGESVNIEGHSVELDTSTRVIASITADWIDRVDLVVPQWLKASFYDRIVQLQPLNERPSEVSAAIDWFVSQASRVNFDGVSLAEDARELLISRPWPGDLEELRKVVVSLIALATSGERVTASACERVLERVGSPGMSAIDNHRRQECYHCAQGLSYVGRSIEASDVYEWVSQFPKVSRDRQFDPWSTGLDIAKAISQRYFFSSDCMHALIRKAYAALCTELVKSNVVNGWDPSTADNTLPSIRAILVNPLGPIKSSSGVMPHMAHLIGAGSRQKALPMGEVADYLAANEETRVILFCDDFSGTGRQILDNLIGVFAADDSLRDTCHMRNQQGNSVVLSVILGVGFQGALESIRASGPDWLPTIALAGETLGERDRAFTESSRVFPDSEHRAWAKDLIVEQIGKHLSPHWPSGFGDLQAMAVTADNVPNNTLPVIHSSGQVHGIHWRALFARASTPSG